MIIIDSDRKVDLTELLIELGYKNPNRLRPEPFDAEFYPEPGRIYIGSYKGLTIICERNLPFTFLTEMMTSREKTLHSFYPGSEICALVMMPSVNLWGYSISRNGRKLRARTGSNETGTILDTGEPLEEERQLLSMSSLDENGIRIYRLEDSDATLFEDQVGEEFVFRISERYFGVRLDEADATMLDTPMWGFSYESSDKRAAVRTRRKRERWFIYIAIIALLLLWHILKRMFWH